MSAPRLTMKALRSRPVLASGLAVAGVGAYFGARSLINPADNAQARVPSPAFGGLGPTTLRLKSSEFVTHDTKRLVFEFPDENAKSGLSLTSSLLTMCWPEGRLCPAINMYTQISGPDQTGTIDFLIKRYPGGLTSTTICSLSPGDTLTFLLEYKQFQWTPNKFAKVHLIAGGVGITPVYQLAQGILNNKEDKTKVNLILGVNSEQELLLREELENYQKMYPDRFAYTFVVSGLEEEKGGLRKGYINEGVLKELVGEVKEDTKVFVCGPQPMMEALIGQNYKKSWSGGILPRMGIAKERVHRF